MIGLLFGSADFVAEAAHCLFDGALRVVRDEIAHLRAQLSLPLAALVLLHTSHAQLRHHRLDEGLRREGGARERLVADRTVSRAEVQSGQTVATDDMG